MEIHIVRMLLSRSKSLNEIHNGWTKVEDVDITAFKIS